MTTESDHPFNDVFEFFQGLNSLAHRVRHWSVLALTRLFVC